MKIQISCSDTSKRFHKKLGSLNVYIKHILDKTSKGLVNMMQLIHCCELSLLCELLQHFIVGRSFGALTITDNFGKQVFSRPSSSGHKIVDKSNIYFSLLSFNILCQLITRVMTGMTSKHSTFGLMNRLIIGLLFN